MSVLFAYLISHTFIGVYEMAIDTIFLCFCEDSARNDGINKPYYMSRVWKKLDISNDNVMLMIIKYFSGPDAVCGEQQEGTGRHGAAERDEAE